MTSPSRRWFVVLSLCAMVVSAGCRPLTTESLDSTTPANASPRDAVAGPTSTADALGEDGHPHLPGAHGGIIVPIGGDSYHAEAVIEKSGNLRLLLLGKDESRIQEVDVQPIKAYVKTVGETEATAIDLVAEPQDGDAAGKTSQFTGQLPEAAIGRAIDVTIPNLRIDGERFRVCFTTGDQDHTAQMPAGVAGEDERDLYFTAGGKYTQADIEANGGITASQKFKGVMSAHDMNPKQGDRICPVTLTKANARFTWTIDGKSYQFCCPPCIDEFVRLAKEQPDQLKDPDHFIK
ncbi:MAG: hypothetical protein ACO1RT_18850 [Planctomycetaceae bacterium]